MFGFWSISTSKIAGGITVISDAVRYLIMKLSGNGAVKSRNNIFLDESPVYNGPVTVNGNSTQGSAGPYGNNWSTFFDASGDFISIASSSAFTLETTDNFTIECWVNPSAHVNAYTPIVTTFSDFNTSSGYLNRWFLGISNNATGNKIRWYDSTGNGFIDSVSSVSLNTWTHIAVVRNSGTITLYVNGVSQATQSTNMAYTTQSGLNIGFVTNGGAFNGYISNVRLVKGTALYTAAFTPSTIALTAVPNTSILTCQNSYFIDNGTHSHTLTPNGDVRTSSFGPFVPSEITASPNTSVAFNGTSYLSSASNSAIAFGTGDFTVEGWLFLTTSENRGVFQISGVAGGLQGSVSNTIALSIDNVGAAPFGMYWAGVYNSGGSALPFVNSWIHFAVTRSSGTSRLFINGTQIISTADNTNYTGSNAMIGGYYNTSYLLKGSISNFRIIKGTALYTAAFTPPTAELTAVANTSLLIARGNSFADRSANNIAITATGTPSLTANSPFANSTTTITPTVITTQSVTPASHSVYFDGSGDMLTVTNLTGPGTGNFTYECWVYPTSSALSYRLIFGIDNYGGTTPFRLYQYGTNFQFWYTGTAGNFIDSNTIVMNQWYHLAATRSGSSLRFFVNGTQVGSTITQSASYPTSNFRIGMDSGSLYPFVGYISNVRAVNGTALYTANFTPSTTQLSAVAGTSLLTCQSPTIIDNSTNAFSITVAGDARPTTNNPFTNTTTNTSVTTSWSGYFDGTGDYIVAPSNTAFAFGTGDFTVECWIHAPTQAGQAAVIGNLFSAADGDSALGVYIGSSNQIIISTWITVLSTSASNVIIPNSWNHIVAVRSGTTFSVFANGTRVSTLTNSNNFSRTTGYQLGIESTGSRPFTGYISNARVVKGTAVYNPSSTAITVPTSALTNIAGTSLLTCQDPRFIDNSTNNFAITVSGDAKTTAFGPFLGKGSMSFNGSTSVLTIADNSAVRLGSVFTLEYWVYLRSYTSPTGIVFSKWDTSTGYSYIFGIDPNGQFGFTMNTNVAVGTSTLTVPLGSWTHVAICRNGSSWNYYVNGRAAGSFTNATVPNANTTPLDIGRNRDTSVWFLNGNLRDFRISNVVRYPGPFIPSTTNLTAESGTTLLIPGINNFNDISSNRLTVTSSNVSINTSNTGQPLSPYDSYYSYFFNGSASLSLASNAAFGLGTGAFTIECWVYPSANPANGPGTILDLRSGPLAESTVLRINSSLNLHFYDGPANADRIITSYVFNLNEWHHLAITRTAAATTANIWVNGTLVDRVAVTANLGAAFPCLVGSNRVAGYGFNGYINNLRIVKDCLYSLQLPPTPYTNSVDNLGVVNGTSLLTCNNRSIVDVANNYAITNTSVTTTNQFVPFNRIYSTYFGGTTGHMTINHSNAINILSGNFTIECWFNSEVVANVRTLIGQWSQAFNSPGLNGYLLRLTSSNQLEFYWGPSNSLLFTGSGTVNMGSWNHVAIVRLGNTFTMYLNGTSVGTTTNTTTSAYIAINHSLGNYYNSGGTIGATGASYYKGYISNARITKGLAVYTSNFTPSTYPLVAGSNTGFLGCQCMNMLDNSGNNLYVFNSSDTRVEPIHPFSGTFTPTSTTTSGALLGGAGQFDGTGDAIILPGNDLYAPQINEDFTFECWVRLPALPASVATIMATDNQAVTGWALIANTNGVIDFYASSTGTWDIATPIVVGTIRAGSWYHLAVTRQTSTIRTFTNGVLSNTVTGRGTAFYRAVLNPFVIGARNTAGTSQNINASIAGVRLLRGSCQYVSNFTPTTTPPVASASTSALLHFRNGGVYDSVSKSNFELLGDTTINQSLGRSGSSVYFDGSGDYLTVPSNAALTLGTGNFTIEFWQNYNSLTNFQTIISSGYSPNAVGGWVVQTGNGDGRINFYLLNGVTAITVAVETGTTVSAGIWYHIAIVRNGTTITIYRNGVSVGSGSDSNNYAANASVVIGGGSNTGINNYWVNGYISNARIVKGTALYTTTFTPSTTPLTAVAGTSLLTCQSPTIVDNSTNNFAITVVGDARVIATSPYSTTSSIYFDGTGDYMIANYPDLAFGTGDFTIEWWQLSEDVSSATQRGVFQTSTTAGGLSTGYTTGIAVFQGAAGVSALTGGCSAIILGTYIAGTSTAVLTVNVWQHIAITRSGGNCRLFVNGVQHGTTTAISGAINATNIAIGGYYSTSYLFRGYIDDFSVIKGYAKYTGNFTPS